MDILKGKVSDLATRFQTWQQDGTLDRLAQKFDQGLAKGVDAAGKAFRWVTENGDTIIVVLKNLGAAFAVVKMLKFAGDVGKAVKTASLFAKTIGTVIKATNPWTLALYAAIAAGTFLIANWDSVKAVALSLWDSAKAVFGGIRDSVTGAFDTAREKVSGFFSWVGEKLSWLDDKLEGAPVIGGVYKGIKSAGGWIADKISGHATGTSYFSGGLTRVNERGGEIMRLPGGTQIIPHDLSQRMLGGPTIKVYVTVQGNVIGNRAYAEEMGDTIVQRILRALRNT